jgi:hypothetical protein
MTTWHVDDRSLRRWIDGTDTLSSAVSVEQHLLVCEPCRVRVGAAIGPASAPALPDLDAVWTEVRDAVEWPTPSRLERILARMGLPAADAKLVAAAPAFRGAWLSGVLLVLAFATLAAVFGRARGQDLFLTAAPLVPCLAVAFSYDPDIQPALEQELATPYPALRLVLLRSLAVLAAGLPVIVTLGVFLPGREAYLWLLPAVGFVAAVLALSTWMNPLRAAAAISALWCGVVLLAAHSGPVSEVVMHARFQVVYALLAGVSTLIVIRRGRHVRELRSQGGWMWSAAFGSRR